MSIQNNIPGQPSDNQQTSADRNADQQKSSDISLPRIDRPEGPFEHSGETARWTEEERAEKNDEDKESGE